MSAACTRSVRATALAAATLLVSASPLAAQAPSTTRVSVSSSGAEGHGASQGVSISGDGRFVAFGSAAADLVTGDTNSATDVFVHDRASGTTERVSLATGGTQANGPSGLPSISGDGRFVAFSSGATNLVSGDTNGKNDCFVHDRLLHATQRVSIGSDGTQGTLDCWVSPSISANGRFVAFASRSPNLIPNDQNGALDVFVHDRLWHTTERVSLGMYGEGYEDSGFYGCSVSADGRFVAFDSWSSYFVPGDSNMNFDIFVRDRLLGSTMIVSVDSNGAVGSSTSMYPSISADGRCVAFTSEAPDLVIGDTNGVTDAFVHDLLSGTTERVSIDSNGVAGNAETRSTPTISADGRFVSFLSYASNLVPGDTNSATDFFVHDRQSGTTERVSVDSLGGQANLGDVPWGRSSMSSDGRFVAFDSLASNLVQGDSNGFQDVFVRDRGFYAPGADLCQAGSGSVIACPCANPPANAPRGCDNSSSTGGARLESSGTASLSFDSLLFATNGEKPTATSVVLQGNAEVSNGLVFGQGVRCVGGALRRLYVKSASGGSISAPGAGDPSISGRSAALGDPIAPGTSRWYAVSYRDPQVLGGCPAASTFNVTQTQLVGWTP